MSEVPDDVILPTTTWASVVNVRMGKDSITYYIDYQHLLKNEHERIYTNVAFFERRFVENKIYWCRDNVAPGDLCISHHAFVSSRPWKFEIYDADYVDSLQEFANKERKRWLDT